VTVESHGFTLHLCGERIFMKPKKSGNRGRCRKLSLFPLDSFSLLRDLLDIFLPINSHINSINETANDHISMNALIIYLSNGFAGRIVITSFARQILDFLVYGFSFRIPRRRIRSSSGKRALSRTTVQ